MEGMEWTSRFTDNDSLGHTTASRRLLPFFEHGYLHEPSAAVVGIYVEYKTEILPGMKCTVRGLRKGNEARFLLNDGKSAKENRASALYAARKNVVLKTAGNHA